MNKRLIVAVCITFFATLLGSLAIRPPSKVIQSDDHLGSFEQNRADSVVWRVPVSFTTNLGVLGDNIVYVADSIAAVSDSTFELNIAEPGEIVPALMIVDAVREQKVNAGYTWLGYDLGKIPASTLIGAVPFGFEPWEYTAWWYEGGGRELTTDIYAKSGVYPVLCGLLGPETAGWFRKPIESLDDIDGLKIRFAGLGGKVMQRLGASVTMLPGPEIFQALEKGAIDATEYSLPNVDNELGFDKVAKFNYFPGWHQVFTSIHMVVGVNAWNNLSLQHQSILENVCTAGVTRNLAKAEAVQGPIIAGFNDKGVTANRFPETILRELKRVSTEVIEEEAAKDVDFNAVYESQLAFKASYQYWKQLAYLPRDFE